MSRHAFPSRQVRVELLVSKLVRDIHGRRVGRIEAVRAIRRGEHCEVESFLLGAYGAFERLAAGRLFRTLVRRLYPDGRTGYSVPWDRMDLSDPARPRVTCSRDDLIRV